MPKTWAKKTCFNLMDKIRYYTMIDIIFQYGWEPVLIHQILIGFEVIREKFSLFSGYYGTYNVLAFESFPRTTTSFGMTTTTTSYTTTTTYRPRQGTSYSVTNQSLL